MTISDMTKAYKVRISNPPFSILPPLFPLSPILSYLLSHLKSTCISFDLLLFQWPYCLVTHQVLHFRQTKQAMISLPTSITISTGQGAKPITENYSVNFNTTPNILIEHFFKVGTLSNQDKPAYEVPYLASSNYLPCLYRSAAR